MLYYYYFSLFNSIFELFESRKTDIHTQISKIYLSIRAPLHVENVNQIQTKKWSRIHINTHVSVSELNTVGCIDNDKKLNFLQWMSWHMILSLCCWKAFKVSEMGLVLHLMMKRTMSSIEFTYLYAFYIWKSHPYLDNVYAIYTTSTSTSPSMVCRQSQIPSKLQDNTSTRQKASKINF